MALNGEIVPVGELADGDVKRMFTLMDTHFSDMEWERFLLDLKEKETVLLMRNPEDGQVEGFSTAMVIDTELDHESIRTVFSGDTIINREFWGEKTLGILWLQYVFQVKKESPDKRVFWFLISMGYKTYRLLRLFFKDYWPRHSVPTPAFEQKLIDHLGASKFGQHFNKERGIISFSGSREKLRCGVAEVDSSKLGDKDIAFFVEKNPGWVHGDELLSIAEISKENLNRRIARTFSLNV